jgi:acetyltransferase
MLQLSQRIAHERLTRMCFLDYDRDMALVAIRQDPATGEQQLLAVGRLSKLHGSREAEFALLVSDPWQGHGLGQELLSRLVQIGRNEKLHRISADILGENTAMQRVAKTVGFTLKRVMGGEYRAELDL